MSVPPALPKKVLDALACPTPVISHESTGGFDLREVGCGQCEWCAALAAVEEINADAHEYHDHMVAADEEIAHLRGLLAEVAGCRHFERSQILGDYPQLIAVDVSTGLWDRIRREVPTC